MQTINFVEFNFLFEEKIKENKDVYFEDLPKKGLLLQLIEWLNTPITASDLDEMSRRQMEILKGAFMHHEQYLKRLKQLLINDQRNYTKSLWITPHTCLLVIEYILINYQNIIFKNGYFNVKEAEQEKNKFSNSQKIALLKGYFAFSQIRLDKLPEGKYHGVSSAESQLIQRIGTHELEQNDVLIFIAELSKACELFSFLEQRNPEIVKDFLKIQNLPSWQKYITKIFEFMRVYLTWSQIRIISPNSVKSEIEYFDKFCPPHNKFNESINFLSLKQFPLLKTEHNVYHFIYKKFAFEKIFKSLYFTLEPIALKAEIKNPKSYLGKHFFEEWICTKYVNKIFNSPRIINCVDSKGDFSNSPINIDQYIRNINNVIIFEYKDIRIADKAKISYVKSEVLKELHKKLVRKESGSKSAIIQLVDFIHNFPSIYAKFDSTADISKVNFYPIIITQDRCLSTPGINQILNVWFSEELKKLGINKMQKVEKLVIINIDTLILYEDVFSANPDCFLNCITEYISYEKIGNNLRLSSFEAWMKIKFQGKKIITNLFSF